MKKLVVCLIGFILLIPLNVSAARGCCSHHGGVSGCSSSGRQICNDGTLSPTCTCTPKVTYVYGCTDPSAKNYNPKANKDNNSCKYYIYGCMDKDAKNYNDKAEKDDNSCEYYKYGCTDNNATNYDKTADKDDGSCKFQSEESEQTNKDSGGVLTVLTIGGIGAGVYYSKKKKNK